MFDTCCKILQFRGSGTYKLGTSVFPVHVGEEEVFAEVIAALKETFSYKKLPLCQKGVFLGVAGFLGDSFPSWGFLKDRPV